MSYLGWLESKIWSVFSSLYTPLDRNWLASSILLCAAFFSLWYKNWCSYSYKRMQLKKSKTKKRNRRKGRRKKHSMRGLCTEFQSNCKIHIVFSTILFLLNSSGKYVSSYHTVQRPLSKLSPNMEQKIKILNIAAFRRVIPILFTEDWDFLPAPESV